ncbi:MULTISPECIES: dihydrolipoamide acetyltransferase family protein [unclassified Frankia]|uniref:dihydrolipoamide acetyltransferase family protein n=1 Tax=unclassified Frankia TaxID=2632575 RepID=UPI002AD3057E|nr:MULTISPECIES: dihydrolipoamide acetyltransferase family protein [unclassified Frankia]
MAVEVLLPKLGLTMQEGTITEWLVPPGGPVRPGDVIMRLATDKVDTDVEAEGEGHFHPVVPAGTTLPPGALVGWLLAAGEILPGAVSGAGPSGAVVSGAVASGAALSGAAAAQPGPAGRLLASPNARRVARARGIDLVTIRGTGPGGRIVSEDIEAVDVAAPPLPAAPLLAAPPPAAPLVRRYAETLGVDLATVAGRGPAGRIRRADVERAAAAAAAAGTRDERPPQAAPPAGPRAGQVIALTGMRGAIARTMHASLQEMAQLTHGYEADVTDLVALRAQLKREWTGTGATAGEPRVPSLNDFVVRAAALALGDHPLLNATIRDGAIHLLPEIHVGVAVAVPDGLLVPVVRDAATRGLLDIAAEVRRLAGAARDKKLAVRDLEGATFVVTSLGGYGVDFFTPVINPPNVAILGVGRVRDGVRWEGDTPRRTSVLTLSLSFDHRAVDGAPAAEYLRTVTALLARPLLLLAG